MEGSSKRNKGYLSIKKLELISGPHVGTSAKTMAVSVNKPKGAVTS